MTDPEAEQTPERSDQGTWMELARQLRVDSARASAAASCGLPTSSMSAADLMAC
jgi:transketolase